MKKKSFKLLTAILISSLCLTSIYGCGKKKHNLTKINLNEVVRSVFYAPMYVAINKGFFKKQGLLINLNTGQGADKTMQQVLSKSSDIGLCGPEQTIYIYNQHKEDYPVLFSKLTQTDGSFLVGRKQEKDFNWKSLKQKTIIGGRPGGMPEMSLEYVLKNHNIDPKKDVNLITNIDFTAAAGAFKSGTGDYIALFEPTASLLQKNQDGYIEASISQTEGNIPYTCFFATKSYIKNNPKIIQKFTNAIYEGQVWVEKHNNKEIADAIKSFFPGNDENILIDVIKNYKKIGAFATSPVIEQKNLNKLMDIIESYKKSLIPTRPPFSNIVDNSFAKKALKNK